MEGQGFVSKNSRLGKPALEHGEPKDGEVNSGIMVQFRGGEAIKLENPHLFVTLPRAEAVYISISALRYPAAPSSPRLQGKH
jgi:hypothetical protein